MAKRALFVVVGLVIVLSSLLLFAKRLSQGSCSTATTTEKLTVGFGRGMIHVKVRLPLYFLQTANTERQR